MPTYSYACTACDNRFDAVQAFTDDALTDCPECSGRLRKLFNAVGVVFKGSGFYRTDSRDSGKSPAGAKSEATSGSGSEKSSGSGDSLSGSSGSSGSSAKSSPAPATAAAG